MSGEPETGAEIEMAKGAAEEPMTRARLLETLRRERARWLATIAAAGDEARLLTPGFAGVWSVRDVIAHITAYERWMLDHMEAHERGVAPPPSALTGKDLEARNHAAHQQTLGLSLAEVQTQAQQVWTRLLAAVERAPEADLLDARRAPDFVVKGWGRDTALWEAISGLTWEHYEEHEPNFAAWSSGAPAACER
jgi:uncharacterized damage-inducible protein DinB